ncbi:MAG: 4a-hydroxytetrahydrobiopterin dehydratase [Limnoraphis sp. WC205]|jgi:4a-hydroxytetrahydrobiopterin dehydratase|nr:4a-hydroxytetrahydrobiopterin dehydratase [Limnoraphis sp. WC205]
MEILSILAISLITHQSLSGTEIPFVLVQHSETDDRRRLTEVEITQILSKLPDWKRENQTIIYTHNFNNFIESINFINCLVEPAETLGHHPDILVSYNKVTISLTTHDQGGLTSLDFQLAESISNLVKTFSETTGKQCNIN